MPRLLMLVEFSDQATPPEGDPPSLTVHGESIRVVPLEGDAPDGAGYLGPSPEEGLLEGSVIWRVEEGEGRFAGATGLITSNFVMRAETGEVAEKQVISLFLP
jgi:hypothetical protein